MKHLLGGILLLFILGSVITPVFAQEDIPIGYVLIPSIDVYQPIYKMHIENYQYVTEDINRRVGWLEGTAWIHGWGRVVLAAHSYGKFSDIDLLVVGDEIIVWDATGAESYFVTGRQVVSVTNTSVLQPTSYPTIMLITCYGNDRLLVFAE